MDWGKTGMDPKRNINDDDENDIIEKNIMAGLCVWGWCDVIMAFLSVSESEWVSEWAVTTKRMRCGGLVCGPCTTCIIILHIFFSSWLWWPEALSRPCFGSTNAVGVCWSRESSKAWSSFSASRINITLSSPLLLLSRLKEKPTKGPGLAWMRGREWDGVVDMKREKCKAKN